MVMYAFLIPPAYFLLLRAVDQTVLFLFPKFVRGEESGREKYDYAGRKLRRQ